MAASARISARAINLLTNFKAALSEGGCYFFHSGVHFGFGERALKGLKHESKSERRFIFFLERIKQAYAHTQLSSFIFYFLQNIFGLRFSGRPKSNIAHNVRVF